MAAEFTGEEIIDIVAGRLASGLMPEEAGAVCCDTRQLQEGQWFVALPGKNFDGHDFLGEAFSLGALGCIVGERGNYAVANPQFPLIAVQSPLEAYQMLARNWRRRLNPRVLAISSSQHGQNRVLSLCRQVLAPSFRLHEESGDHTLGTVLSVLAAETSLPDDTQILLAQISPDELGQTEILARALVPTVAVITESSFRHLRAHHEDHIARCECDLLAHLEKGRGVALVARLSPDLLHRVKYHFADRAVVFEPASASSNQALNLAGPIEGSGAAETISDLWCVVEACRRQGVPDETIAKRLSVSQ